MPIPKNPLSEAPKTARERIYNALKDWIIDGTLMPGEKISDTEISQYFSVSRTPVREAIQLLADQKLIEIFPGKESRIAPIDRKKACRAYMILAELHALALQFAFPLITDEIIAELDAINESLREKSQLSDAGVLTQDKAFHDIFLKLADNDFLTSFTSTLSIHVARVENLYYRIQKDSMSSVQEHDEILKALKERDLETAQKFMRYNWTHTVELIDWTLSL